MTEADRRGGNEIDGAWKIETTSPPNIARIAETLLTGKFLRTR
jgi:hypothetical protein